MTIRTATGLTLALTLLTYPLQAQEVQWRAAAPRTAQPAASPSSRPVTLAQPRAVDTDRTMHDSAVTPVSFRPVGIVRVPTDAERFPAPLPSGPMLPMTTQIENSPRSEKPEAIPVRPKPVPAMNEGDERIIPHGPSSDAPLDGSPAEDCASCGGVGGECGCCECSCVCDMCRGRFFGRRGRCRSGCWSSCCESTCCEATCCETTCCETCCCETCCCEPICCDCTCCSTCDSCCGCACGCCFVDGCNSRQFFWVSAEYLLWSITPDNVPPLLTTGPIGDGAQVGIPGRLDTTVLYGRDQLANPLRSGARFTAGFWLPGVDRLGVEVSYFFLGQGRSTFFADNNTNPILMRPFVNAQTGEANVIPTAYPVNANGFLQTVGSFRAINTSDLWGIEANLRGKLWCGPCAWLDALVGYRHLDLSELLVIDDVENGDRFIDRFSTRNNFNGGQLGLEGQWNFARRFTITGTAKVALGNVNQVLGINGQSSVAFPPPAVQSGGFLALESNISSREANRFAVMPNCGVKLGWNATENLRFFVGYEFLYLSNVIRVGEQVDPRINRNLIPGATSVSGSQPQQPAVLFRTNDFWAHGVNFGALYYW